jgi:hypothetical protein
VNKQYSYRIRGEAPFYSFPFFSSKKGQLLKPVNLEIKSVNVRHCHMAIFDKSLTKVKKRKKIEGKTANNKFWEQMKNHS